MIDVGRRSLSVPYMPSVKGCWVEVSDDNTFVLRFSLHGQNKLFTADTTTLISKLVEIKNLLEKEEAIGQMGA